MTKTRLLLFAEVSSLPLEISFLSRSRAALGWEMRSGEPAWRDASRPWEMPWVAGRSSAGWRGAGGEGGCIPGSAFATSRACRWVSNTTQPAKGEESRMLASQPDSTSKCRLGQWPRGSCFSSLCLDFCPPKPSGCRGGGRWAGHRQGCRRGLAGRVTPERCPGTSLTFLCILTDKGAFWTNN